MSAADERELWQSVANEERDMSEVLSAVGKVHAEGRSVPDQE